MENIERALTTAKYNEAVIVTVPGEEDYSSADDSNSKEGKNREIVLVATLDEENGGVSWKDAMTCTTPSPSVFNLNKIKEETLLDVSILRHLRTKKWVLPMLNDERRNRMYDAAICTACERVVQKRLIQEKRKEINILDIGTGTGLLAMLAAKHCKRKIIENIGALSTLAAIADSSSKNESTEYCEIAINIVSVEMSSAMAKLARNTISEECNGYDPDGEYTYVQFENGIHKSLKSLKVRIQIVEGHSTDSNFSPFCDSGKADLCTSELLESGFLGEGIIPSLRDAWARLLKTDAEIVPACGRVYCRVLSSKEHIACYRGPVVTSEGVERLCISSEPRDVLLGGESKEGAGIRVPVHGKSLMELEGVAPLSSTAKVLDFDFAATENICSSGGRTTKHTITATRSGTAHGVLFWWDLSMLKGMDTAQVKTHRGVDTVGVVYSTDPTDAQYHFQDHWQNCLFVFGEDYDKCLHLVEGKDFSLVAQHDDYGISFSIENVLESSDNLDLPASKRAKVFDKKYVNVNVAPASNFVATEKCNQLISPDRAMQLNDSKRTQAIRNAIRDIVKDCPDATILDLSDFSLCSLMAAINGATNVYSLESSSGDLPMTAARVAQIGNNLHFQIINAHAESLELLHFGGERVDVVVAEPYYSVLEGWHLQEALNLFYLCRSFKQRGFLANNCRFLPAVAKVMACAIECHDISSAYGGLDWGSHDKETDILVCDHKHALLVGTVHDTVDKYASRYTTFDSNFPMWQYQHRQLCEPFEITRLDFGSDTIHGNGEWKKAPFTQSGDCHALMVWLEYYTKTESPDGTTGEVLLFSTNTKSHKQTIRKVGMSESGYSSEKKSEIHCRAFFGGLGNCEDHDFEIKIE